MTTQTRGPNAGDPARPRRMTNADEYLSLFEQRARIDRRLDELVALMDGEGLPGGVRLVPMPSKSKLRLVGTRSGVALFKGGRNDG